jgi:hypothetical protein
MRTMVGILVALVVLVSGCGKGSGDRVTGPTAEAPAGARRISAKLQNHFLYEHNAAFNAGRTARWVAPIPIYTGTGDPSLDEFLLAQFLPWEAALAGAGGSPFFSPQPMARRLPKRGIFFAIQDLPPGVVAAGDPIDPLAEKRRRVAPALPRVTLGEASRHIQAPEIRANGEIQRCVIILDPDVAGLDDHRFGLVVRHEVGHCLGFIGHVASGLMRPTCCADAITPDVAGMMRTLYNLPPGTEVAP